MTAWRPALQFLAPEEIDRIVSEACSVLERTGVLVENQPARALLSEAGASIAGDRITIPERLVRESIERAPSRVVLYDRDGSPAMDLGDSRVHFDPGSAAVSVLDHGARAKRPATTADLVRIARLVDRLPHYAAQSTALVPSDVPAQIGDRYRLYLALANCGKPIVTGTFATSGFAPMRAMLAAIRGGEAALAEKPLAIFDACVSPPLKWSDLTCQSLIDSARAMIPAEVIPMPLTGATSPVTLRATVIQHCAEGLSGLVIHQLARPGAPFVFGGACSAFDMRAGSTPMGAIETMMLASAYAQVGRQLGLPTHGYFVVSDAKLVDYQAGLESGIGALIGAMSGINVISGAGMLDFLLTQSLEKIVLDHEACGIALRAIRGIENKGEDATALIAQVVERGEFLSHGHTRANWRSEIPVASRLIDRASFGDWEAQGGQSAEARAASEVERILAQSDDQRLDDHRLGELTKIMAAEARASGLDALPAPPRGI
jgi:trimethylamine---corrinoid protein Co-methyltransferase